MGEYLHSDITEQIIGAAFEVHKTLGPGFLEQIYEKALANELRQRQLKVQRQMDIVVEYKGERVGKHRLDLVVEDKVIVELKSASALVDEHTAVVFSYLSAAKLSVALLINFGRRKLEFKRIAAKDLPPLPD